jgi:ectoine hydroxylase-related dioxygenase (phytanoyl-CoA dioxygenase family)
MTHKPSGRTLSFDQGSQQGLHQDTAYVVVNRPMELAACWIALEDVQPGSGELMYVPGSHRYPDFDFGFGEKHWRGRPKDASMHSAWSRWITDEAARRDLKLQTFLACKGDILIWHADLAHGGAPVRDKSLTRQSLVGHFCPATARPYYFDHGKHRDTVRRYGKLLYASDHYDLRRRRGIAAALPSWIRRIRSHLPAFSRQ